MVVDYHCIVRTLFHRCFFWGKTNTSHLSLRCYLSSSSTVAYVVAASRDVCRGISAGGGPQSHGSTKGWSVQTSWEARDVLCMSFFVIQYIYIYILFHVDHMRNNATCCESNCWFYKFWDGSMLTNVFFFSNQSQTFFQISQQQIIQSKYCNPIIIEKKLQQWTGPQRFWTPSSRQLFLPWPHLRLVSGEFHGGQGVAWWTAELVDDIWLYWRIYDSMIYHASICCFFLLSTDIPFVDIVYIYIFLISMNLIVHKHIRIYIYRIYIYIYVYINNIYICIYYRYILVTW